MKRSVFVGILFWSLMASIQAVAQLPPGQTTPDVAFDTGRNLFCATYSTVVVPDVTMSVQLVGPDGAPVGAATQVATVNNFSPAQIAYDGVLQDYLVVWPSFQSGTLLNVYGHLISGDGALAGNLFTIVDAAADQNLPAVAFDTVNGRFLVAWNDQVGADEHIFGQLIQGDGTHFGAELPISAIAAADTEAGPQMAYDSSHQRFLVTWADMRNGVDLDVVGQLLNADGSPQGASFAISAVGAAGHQQFPDAAFDNVNNRFLVTWVDERSGNKHIYGQLVGSDGTLMGNNVPIFVGPLEQPASNVAFDAATQRYLVVWAHTTNGVDYYVRGQYVGADGTPIGSDFQVSSGKAQTMKPAIAANAFCPNFLVAYPDTASPTVIQYAIEGDACETTPPTVGTTSPAADAVDVAVDAPITATFSEGMRASTITSSTFTVSGGVTGTVTYDTTAHIATFTPASALANATAYTATVTTGVKDLVGNSMAADSTWSFTTVAAAPPPESGGGCSLIPSR